MAEDSKRMIQKTEDERLHDLAILYFEVGSADSPSDFFRRYSDVKEQMRVAQEEVKEQSRQAQKEQIQMIKHKKKQD